MAWAWLDIKLAILTELTTNLAGSQIDIGKRHGKTKSKRKFAKYKSRGDVMKTWTAGLQTKWFRRSCSWLAAALLGAVTVAALLLLMPSRALALPLYDGQSAGNNLEITLDTTVSFSSFYRVNKPSAVLLSASNENESEGDLNFQHGFVGNVAEILPVLDIKDGDIGAHFSGEFFVNSSYLDKNTNDQPDTINAFTTPSNRDFTSETRESNGLNGKMLDAFAFDTFRFGADQNQTLTIKAGQQTLLWGQGLFFGANGISGGQAPIDVVSAQDLVNPQSQQIYEPVGQIVVTYQPDNTYTLQAYYQYEWMADSLQGVGSYFSTSDVTGPGAQRLIALSYPGLGNLDYYYGKALTPPSQNGEFGGSVQAQYGNYDVGLFALRFDSKTPVVNIGTTDFSVTPYGYSLGHYNLLYPRDIQLYGASVSTTIGATNVAGEISGRRNMPLVTGGVLQTAANPGNASSDPLYPVGDTITGLASFIYSSPALRFDPGGVTILGEVEYLDVVAVTANKAELSPGRSSAASALDFEVEPTYFDVLPNLELQFPVSVLYDYAGNSEMDSSVNHGTGTFSAGITATYRQTWIASLNYVDYFGRPGLSLAPNVTEDADRGYITLNLQHTF
jgi:hypothetical protein